MNSRDKVYHFRGESLFIKKGYFKCYQRAYPSFDERVVHWGIPKVVLNNARKKEPRLMFHERIWETGGGRHDVNESPKLLVVFAEVVSNATVVEGLHKKVDIEVAVEKSYCKSQELVVSNNKVLVDEWWSFKFRSNCFSKSRPKLGWSPLSFHLPG